MLAFFEKERKREKVKKHFVYRIDSSIYIMEKHVILLIEKLNHDFLAQLK